MVGTDRKTKRLPAGLYRSRYFFSGQVDPYQPEIPPVQHQQFMAGLIVQQIGGETVLVVDGIEQAVQRDQTGTPPVGNIINDDSAIVAPAQIDRTVIGSKRDSQERPIG